MAIPAGWIDSRRARRHALRLVPTIEHPTAFTAVSTERAYPWRKACQICRVPLGHGLQRAGPAGPVRDRKRVSGPITHVRVIAVEDAMVDQHRAARLDGLNLT